jgi:hypothetical protein
MDFLIPVQVYGTVAGVPVPVPPAVPVAGATPLDAPVDRRLTSVAGGGALTLTLPAVPAGQRGVITALGITASNFLVLRTTTRVNGLAVAPMVALLGVAGGPLQTPDPLAAPIALAAGDVFSLLLENTGVPAMDLAGRILGWTAPL